MRRRDPALRQRPLEAQLLDPEPQLDMPSRDRLEREAAAKRRADAARARRRADARTEASSHQQARREVARALARGMIRRSPCEVCGSIVAEAHHPDHTKPLEVRWLCRMHHRAADRAALASRSAEPSDDVGDIL